MNAKAFVDSLTNQTFPDVFNPYRDHCDFYDLSDAPMLRSKTLLACLESARTVEVDALWIGRDLGYRGGRRTGLALTDDAHLQEHARRWNVTIQKVTKGENVSERTANVIWSQLDLISSPIFLWNVFPFHPHEPNAPLTNRAHNKKERDLGVEILASLIDLLRPRRIIAIGNDAYKAVEQFQGCLKSDHVRHPSYGGQRDFIQQIQHLYDLTAKADYLRNLI